MRYGRPTRFWGVLRQKGKGEWSMTINKRVVHLYGIQVESGPEISIAVWLGCDADGLRDGIKDSHVDLAVPMSTFHDTIGPRSPTPSSPTYVKTYPPTSLPREMPSPFSRLLSPPSGSA